MNSTGPARLPLAQRRVPSFKLQDGCASPNKKMKRRVPSFRNGGFASDDIDVQGGLQGRKASFSLETFDIEGLTVAGDDWGTAGGHGSGNTPRVMNFGIDDNCLLGDGHKGEATGTAARTPSFRAALDLSDLEFMGREDSAEAAVRKLQQKAGQHMGAAAHHRGSNHRTEVVNSADLDALADRRLSEGSNIEEYPDARRVPSFSFMEDMLAGPRGPGGAGSSRPRGAAGSNKPYPTVSKKNSFAHAFDMSLLDLASPRRMGGSNTRDQLDLDELLISLEEDASMGQSAGSSMYMKSGGSTAAAAAAVAAAAAAVRYQGGAGSMSAGTFSPGQQQQFQSGPGHVRSSSLGSDSASKRQTSEEVAKRLPVHVLENFYHVPLNVAAKELNVSLTMLKKLCRQDGIKRWPHRQVSSLNKSIDKLEQKLMMCKEEKAVKAILAKMAPLQSKRTLIIKTASAGLDPDILNAIFAARPGELNEEEILRTGDYSQLTAMLATITREKREASYIERDPMSLDETSRDSISSTISVLPLDLPASDEGINSQDGKSSSAAFGSYRTSSSFMLDPPVSAPANLQSYTQGFFPPSSAENNNMPTGGSSLGSKQHQALFQQHHAQELSPTLSSTSSFFRNKLNLGTTTAPASSAGLLSQQQYLNSSASQQGHAQQQGNFAGGGKDRP